MSQQEKRAKQRKAKKLRQKANKAARKAKGAELAAGAEAAQVLAKETEKRALHDRLQHAKDIRQARRDPQLRDKMKDEIAGGDGGGAEGRPSIATMLSDMGITGVEEQSKVLSQIDKMDPDQMLKFMQRLLGSRPGAAAAKVPTVVAEESSVITPHEDDVSPPGLV